MVSYHDCAISQQFATYIGIILVVVRHGVFFCLGAVVCVNEELCQNACKFAHSKGFHRRRGKGTIDMDRA
jgi:hypothetical protein